MRAVTLPTHPNEVRNIQGSTRKGLGRAWLAVNTQETGSYRGVGVDPRGSQRHSLEDAFPGGDEMAASTPPCTPATPSPHPQQTQTLRTGHCLTNAEGEQNLWAKGNPWKKSFKSQPGLFLEGAPTHRMGCGRGRALCWSQRKPRDGLRGFLVLFWANLDLLGTLGKPLPVVQASFRVWERPHCL